MSHIIRNAVVLIALATLAIPLTGCHKSPEKAAEAPPSPAPIVDTAPLTFANKTDDAEVSLTFPGAIKSYPVLHMRLFGEAQTALNAFADKAHADRAELVADGFPVPAYYRKIDWKITAQGAQLVSLYATQDEYNGGAHPNSTIQALLWDKTRDDLMPSQSLFLAGADMKVVDSYLCGQIEAERSRRLKHPVSQAKSGFSCPKLIDSRLILIPSTTGRIGAIDTLYQPYEVGAYYEGAFEIRIPQSQLKGLIDPEFAGDFGGEPVADMALPKP